jgi:outer membrane protein TolC
VAVYDQTVLAALQQAADAVSQYQSSRAALPLQQQAWQVAQKRAAASARRVRAGLDNGITRLQQEDAALAAHSDYLDAAAGHQQAWSQLQAALGGGFQAAQGGDK